MPFKLSPGVSTKEISWHFHWPDEMSYGECRRREALTQTEWAIKNVQEQLEAKPNDPDLLEWLDSEIKFRDNLLTELKELYNYVKTASDD